MKKNIMYCTPETLEAVRLNTDMTALSKAKEDRKRNNRLFLKYGITLADYEKMLSEQGGKCWICGHPPLTISLSVDHDHKWNQIKIHTVRYPDGWAASAVYRGEEFLIARTKRNDAIREIKKRLKSFSVRGLLCFPCNSGLRKYSDDPIRLARASEYLRKFQSGRN